MKNNNTLRYDINDSLHADPTLLHAPPPPDPNSVDTLIQEMYPIGNNQDTIAILQQLAHNLTETFAAFAALGPELTILGTMIATLRDESEQNRTRAQTAEAALAAKERWQTDPPTPGRWRVSIRPEIRRGFPSVVECEVWPSPSGMTVNYRPGSDPLPLDQDWFVGAKWQRIEEVADPFDAGERPHSV